MSKYPNVSVPLSGQDGNIFFIIARISRAMKAADVPQEDVHKFQTEVQEATSYDEALRVCMRWVECT